MHFESPTTSAALASSQPWYRELTRYHWFVLIVSALGWMFDCLDQQLFNYARGPAIAQLRGPQDVQLYGGWATTIFMIGWATGGIVFGIMGDRLGRAKTMVLTILIYSLFTGLSALSVSFWDFVFYRFLTGLGVGGEFAVGVALVAEVMPERARPHALGWLQALSAIGNITAGFVNIGLAPFEAAGTFGDTFTPWRWMFVVGALPALLALAIRRKLKEPERWTALRAQTGVGQQLGSISELFGVPRWRKNAILGLLLATAGVVGLWGIGFFGFDLVRSVFRDTFEAEARADGESEWDRDFIRLVVHDGEKLDEAVEPGEENKKFAISNANFFVDGEAKAIYGAALALRKEKEDISAESVLKHLDKNQNEEDRKKRAEYIGTEPPSRELKELREHIAPRSKNLNVRLTIWAGIYGLLFNVGAFFGIYAFKNITMILGRKATFAITFTAAMVSTALTFWFLKKFTDVFWMVPIMGFFQIALFGGYAIYFPELFPTRLRSTGTSFCYNVGRYLAAPGPVLMGTLGQLVFGHLGQVQSWRYAGVTMCSFFLVGLVVLPFATETKGQPLPE